MTWKKLAIGLLILVIFSQLPFAYRRYRLGQLNAAIQQLNSQRASPSIESSYREIKGVIHVHSFLGGHSPGRFEEIIDAAIANQLQFVLMTEHPARDYNTSELTLRGSHSGVLFLNGNEISSREGERLLVIPGDAETGKTSDQSTASLLAAARSSGRLAIVAYPQEFKSWTTDGYGGIEIYNLFTNARRINSVLMFFDGLWSLSRYHTLLFANFYARPNEALEKWDAVNRGRRVVGLAGNDAHANIGFRLNDSSGKPFLGLSLDPYETSFRLVRVHLLVPSAVPLNEGTILDALSQGHCFIGFDLFGDTSGFSFSASNSVETRIQGDEIALSAGVRLTIVTPVPARLVLFKDGQAIQDTPPTSQQEFSVKERGNYRVEIYLPQLKHRVSKEPWIISNPIYVR